MIWAIGVLLWFSLALNLLLFFHKRVPKGRIVVIQTDEGKTVFSLELDKSPEEIAELKSITFEVVRN